MCTTQNGGGALWSELLIDPGKNANFSDFNIIPLVEKSQNRVRNVKLTFLENEKNCQGPGRIRTLDLRVQNSTKSPSRKDRKISFTIVWITLQMSLGS